MLGLIRRQLCKSFFCRYNKIVLAASQITNTEKNSQSRSKQHYEYAAEKTSQSRCKQYYECAWDSWKNQPIPRQQRSEYAWCN